MIHRKCSENFTGLMYRSAGLSTQVVPSEGGEDISRFSYLVAPGSPGDLVDKFCIGRLVRELMQ